MNKLNQGIKLTRLAESAMNKSVIDRLIESAADALPAETGAVKPPGGSDIGKPPGGAGMIDKLPGAGPEAGAGAGQVEQAFGLVKEFDAVQMEEFMLKLATLFTADPGALDNMDAPGIGTHINAAHGMLKSRTGN